MIIITDHEYCYALGAFYSSANKYQLHVNFILYIYGLASKYIRRRVLMKSSVREY